MNFTEKIADFFKGVFTELKKVSWITRQDLLQYTIIVVASTVLTAVFLGGLDYLFSSIIKTFIFKY